MDLKKKLLKGKINQDKETLLMIYQGVFKNNIKEYSERVIPKLKVKKNYAR